MQAGRTADNLSVCPSEPKLCPEHICYVILDRNTKLGMWTHILVVMSLVLSLFWGHCDVDLEFWP